MENVIAWMATPKGRFYRIVIGLNLLWIGTYVLGMPLGHWVQAIALVPLVSAILNVCILAPIVHKPLHGAKIA